jgi:hypothetical protein
MNIDLQKADSRLLHEPFALQLRESGPQIALSWLVEVLSSQSPGLRSSNSYLVAYTGCPEAIDWLEVTVDSPVSTHWGEGAALLGTPWSRIKLWLSSGTAKQLMALDTLIAYRAPSPNMTPLAQIAAATLSDAPSIIEYEMVVKSVITEASSLRLRKSVENALAYADEILSRQNRGVAVHDLPLLFLQPELFANASGVLRRHEVVMSGMRQSIQNLLKDFKLKGN